MLKCICIKGAANAASVGARQGGSSAAMDSNADAATRKTGMTLDEATQILNLEKGAIKQEELQAKYDTMFKANDPAAGSSFYLQSKIFRAKERLDMEFGSGSGSSTASPQGESTNAEKR